MLRSDGFKNVYKGLTYNKTNMYVKSSQQSSTPQQLLLFNHGQATEPQPLSYVSGHVGNYTSAGKRTLKNNASTTHLMKEQNCYDVDSKL